MARNDDLLALKRTVDQLGKAVLGVGDAVGGHVAISLGL
jgi:hypothetical protein